MKDGTGMEYFPTLYGNVWHNVISYSKLLIVNILTFNMLNNFKHCWS